MDRKQRTYCNPLPLPDYPTGVLVGLEEGAAYRETADPSVLYEDGVWYLYPSGHLAYRSTDGVTWEHITVSPEKAGFAPTAVRHRGKYYLTASAYTSPSGHTDLYVGDTPLGPFTLLGAFLDTEGKEMAVCDPMLFSDDDGKLYLYFGGGNDGIYGAELTPGDPRRLLSEPVNLIRYHPEHIWERSGDYHENPAVCWLEGGWMYKKNGVYYLVYCAPGTEFSSYSLGAYKSTSPLTGFVYQKNNPFLSNEGRGRTVRGCGHGCVVDGPDGEIYAFYTSTVGHFHRFERMVGMDRLYIDENGDLASRGTTELPQAAPGSTDPFPPLLPLTVRKPLYVSSELPGREGACATEENLFCRWVPAPEDPCPTLTVELGRFYRIFSFRVIFSEEDPGDRLLPFLPRRFVIEARDGNGDWKCVLDRSDGDGMIVYAEVGDPVTADALRFRLTEDCPSAAGIRNFTAFGWAERNTSCQLSSDF